MVACLQTEQSECFFLSFSYFFCSTPRFLKRSPSNTVGDIQLLVKLLAHRLMKAPIKIMN